MTTLNPSTAAELAANLATTRGDAALEARRARALDPIANPLARPYAADLVRYAQALHPKLTPTRAAELVETHVRAAARYDSDAVAFLRSRPSTAQLYATRAILSRRLAADLRRYAQTGELARP